MQSHATQTVQFVKLRCFSATQTTHQTSLFNYSSCSFKFKFNMYTSSIWGRMSQAMWPFLESLAAKQTDSTLSHQSCPSDFLGVTVCTCSTMDVGSIRKTPFCKSCQTFFCSHGSYDLAKCGRIRGERCTFSLQSCRRRGRQQTAVEIAKILSYHLCILIV